ncbi:MAG: hypothetical protein ACI9MF_001246 [Gammaproteobacteria bacterium]|jgi:hypothetical protein
MLIALVLAWCLVGTHAIKLPMALELFKGPDKLLSSHLDFLMMTMLLLGFYAAKVPLPAWVRWPMAIGSIGNPSAFLIRAILPEVKHPLIGIFIITTITLTTFGYAMASIKVFRSSLK